MTTTENHNEDEEEKPNKLAVGVPWNDPEKTRRPGLRSSSNESVEERRVPTNGGSLSTKAGLRAANRLSNVTADQRRQPLVTKAGLRGGLINSFPVVASRERQQQSEDSSTPGGAREGRRNTGQDPTVGPDAFPGAFNVVGTGTEMIEEVASQSEIAARNNDGEELSEAGSPVVAHVVDEVEALQEAESNLIANAAQAEVVNQEAIKKRQLCAVAIALLIIAALAVAVGVSVGPSEANSNDMEDIILQALVEQNDPANLDTCNIRRFKKNGEIVVEGFSSTYVCDPVACITAQDENSTQCVIGKDYEPGCCAGVDCPEETKCGEFCPDHPFPCKPKRQDCRSVACMECEAGPDGEVLYNLREFMQSFDCLATGIKQDKETGEEYKWAIACGPVESGGTVEDNMDVGEYSCVAFRDGPGITVSLSNGIPCHWIQIRECGCAPSDVFSFGVEPPDPEVGWTPCLSEQDCPFLCSDAPGDKAKNLCYAFGGIEWWEGGSFYNESFFQPLSVSNDSLVKISIFDDESSN